MNDTKTVRIETKVGPILVVWTNVGYYEVTMCESKTPGVRVLDCFADREQALQFARGVMTGITLFGR